MADVTEKVQQLDSGVDELENRPDFLEGRKREEKKTGEVLHRSGEMYWKVFEASPQPMLLMQGQRIVEGNTAALASLGLPGKVRPFSLTLADISPDHQPDGLLSSGAFARHLNGERLEKPSFFQWTFLRNDGLSVLVEMSLIPFTAGGVDYILSTWQDPSHRSHVEKAFLEDQRTFQAIFDNTFQFTGLMTPDGILTEANKTALDFAGAKLSEVKNRPFWETPWWRHSENGRQKLRDSIDRAAAGELVRYETTVCAADGTPNDIDFSIKPVRDDSGKVILLIPEGRDISERKKAEEALKRSERRGRAVLEQQHQLAGVVSLEGILLEANRTALEFAGLQESDVIGRPFWDTPWWTHSPREQQRLQEAVTEARTGRLIAFDTTHVGTDGVQHYVEFTLRPVSDDSGEIMFLIAEGHDITERKLAEERLRESEEQYRSFVSHISEGIYRIDMIPPVPVDLEEADLIQAIDRCAVVAEINTALAQMYGLTISEMVGRKATDFAPGYGARAILALKSPDRSVAQLETRDIDKNGQDLFLSESFHAEIAGGLLKRIWGVQTNITARKKSEEALRESERNYREIYNATSESIFIQEMGTGAILAVNDRAVEMFGYSPSEFPTLTLNDLSSGRSPYSEENAREWLRKAACEGPQTFEWLAKKNSGELFWVEISLRKSEIGGKGCILAVSRDMTERKKAEEEKASLQTQLLQAQKMESVGRLAGGVAHDFNNMLSVILGHCELAMNQVSVADPLHANLGEVKKAAQRSADLTRQLLAFARRQMIDPQVLDLNETVEGMLKMLRRLIGEEIDLEWNPGRDLAPVKIDPSQVDQVLANLCVNARDAIGGNGKVIIGTKNETLDGDYGAFHADASPGEFVMLAVEDDGCGMDQNVLDHLFEPFFTTKPVGEGTGLGLSTVYGIVKQNGGFINVRSQPAKGSVIEVFLPRSREKLEKTLPHVHMEPSIGGKETILLVEDEPSILSLVKKSLEELGYTVLAGKAPGEALRLVEQHPGDIHFLITDVVMPEMSGRELAKRLVAKRPQLKILYMSGYAAEVIVHHGVLDEGVHFIRKPFQMKDLAQKIRKMLDET